MFNQAFLTQNNLLDSNQSGFRSGHSTETALLSVVEALRLARADSKSSILILLDLSAAFDTVNHQILLSTQLAKVISVTALQWLSLTSQDRFFKVSWRGEVSKSHHLTTGVSQGLSSWTTSLLCLHGIIRFCDSETRLSLLLFHTADDTQLYLYFQPDDPDDSCSHLSLSNRHFLMDEWPPPSTQIAKTERLWFHQPIVSQHNFTTIQLGTSTITPSKTARNLGWTIAMLSWQVFQTVLSNLYN